VGTSLLVAEDERLRPNQRALASLAESEKSGAITLSCRHRSIETRLLANNLEWIKHAHWSTLSPCDAQAFECVAKREFALVMSSRCHGFYDAVLRRFVQAHSRSIPRSSETMQLRANKHRHICISVRGAATLHQCGQQMAAIKPREPGERPHEGLS
jgi:hypothetical protein